MFCYNKYAIAIIYCESGQDRNIAALSKSNYVRWFICMNQDEKFMSLALKEAQKAYLLDEVPVGAVIVKDNKVIAEAYNLREKSNDPTSHAEVNAIRKACKKLQSWRLEDCTIYVTIEPCSMCAGTLLQCRIGRIVYGAKDLKGGAIESSLRLFESKNINHHPIIEGGVLEQECSSLITSYFKSKRNK